MGIKTDIFAGFRSIDTQSLGIVESFRRALLKLRKDLDKIKGSHSKQKASKERGNKQRDRRVLCCENSR